METERIMERVRRLLALANDPAASDNEQRIALEQAQRLMDRHAIEQWQLERDHDDIEIIRKKIDLETNPCNRFMASLAYIVAQGNRCRATYWFRKAGNGRSVITGITLYGVRSDVDKTEAIWTAMETSRAVMWRERARTTRNAKANAAWRNGYYQGFQEEIAHRYGILRREMESDDTGRELVAVRSDHVDAWIEANVAFAAKHPKPAGITRASRAAYRHGREDGSRQAIGLRETGGTGQRTLQARRNQ
ncbi:DUF2786 domain-containing protein [Bifidobacterium dentium]|uniref:DUF2786 domain-containing protein n=1 Tax=Bifidobacterium dentium TaxID=1689 RepID=UPI00321AA52A